MSDAHEAIAEEIRAGIAEVMAPFVAELEQLESELRAFSSQVEHLSEALGEMTKNHAPESPPDAKNGAG